MKRIGFLAGWLTLALSSCAPAPTPPTPLPPPTPPAATVIEPLYRNDFSAAPVGPIPAEFMVMEGRFEVVADGDNQVLRAPVQLPTDHGFLCGPVRRDATAVVARIRAEKFKRQFPQMGVGLHGLEGLRLKLITATGQLELTRNGEKITAVPCAWTSGQWTWFRLQSVPLAEGGWAVAGKAWADGSAEPAAWQLTATVREELEPGRASVWTAPFSNTAADIDDIAVWPAAP